MTQDQGSIFRPSQPSAERYGLHERSFGSHHAILSMIRLRCQVLDVGCAGGSMGERIRRECQAVVIGLENDPAAAEIAANRLDAVVTGDVGDDDVRAVAARYGPYDQIVLGDVLEHTTEPDVVLRQLRSLLAADGSFVISLPNALTLRARLRLLAGVMRYDDSGIFDRTHLRFFSIASARALVAAAGLEIQREIVVGPLSHRWGRAGARLTAIRPGLLAQQIVMDAKPC